jgi:hypothetical protein
VHVNQYPAKDSKPWRIPLFGVRRVCGMAHGRLDRAIPPLVYALALKAGTRIAQLFVLPKQSQLEGSDECTQRRVFTGGALVPILLSPDHCTREQAWLRRQLEEGNQRHAAAGSLNAGLRARGALRLLTFHHLAVVSVIQLQGIVSRRRYRWHQLWPMGRVWTSHTTSPAAVTSHLSPGSTIAEQ